MMMIKTKFLVILLAILGQYAIAQQITITGRVTDSDTGEGLPGATVKIVSGSVGTVTDIDGHYSLKMDDSSVSLSFSYLGYLSQEVAVASKSAIDVALHLDAKALDEVVVVGYTTQKKSDLTGAIAVVDVDAMGKVPYANVLQGLAGRVAGVNIQQDGQPGQGRTQVRIRGLTTINNNNPLYVIDGVPTTENLDNLNPNDIESIQVLKDASASIYGVRSATGVIIITTKKGRKGVLNVDAGAQYGVQTIANKLKLLDAQQWGDVYWKAFRNTFPGVTPSHPQYSDGEPSESATISTTPFIIANQQVYQYSAKGTDWYDQVYRNASQKQYFANVTAGSEKSNVLFGVSYFNQDGLIKETNYDRFTARINSNLKITNWINVGENLSVSYSNQVSVGNQQGQDGIPLDVIRQHPLLPVYDTNGNYAGRIDGFPDVRNMVSVLEKNKDNNTDTWRVFGNAYAEADLFKPLGAIGENQSLKIRSSLGVDYSRFYDRRFNAKFSEGQYDVRQNSLTNTFGEGLTTTITNTLEYNAHFGSNNIKVLAGQESVAYTYKDLTGRATGYEIETKDFTYLTAGSNSLALGTGTEWGILSYFSTVEYSFKGKYLLNGIIRQDQTSRFKPKGYFPTVSAGWKLSEESFLKPLMGSDQIINSLKLRGSYGILGNQAISNEFPTLSLVGSDINHADYDLNGTNNQVNTGNIVTRRANANLQWETTKKMNVGLDMNFLNNSFNLTADYYINKTEDIIFGRPQVNALGEGSFPEDNIINMETKGFDVGLGYFFEKNDFNFSANLQASHYNSVVTFIPDNVGSLDANGIRYITGGAVPGEVRVAEGKPFGSFYGYEVEGIFQSVEDVAGHATQGVTGEQAVGRLKYKDVSGPEGTPDGIIDVNDRTFIGNPNPDATFGLNLTATYKGLTLSTFLYSAIGQDIYNTTKWYTDFAQNGVFNRGVSILDAWSPTNTGASVPAPTLNNDNREDNASSYYIEDGSYVRMRSLRLGYNLPKKWTPGFNVNLYSEVQNVYTLTNYSGIDPEVPYPDNARNFPGVDRGVYPLPRTFLFGLNIKL